MLLHWALLLVFFWITVISCDIFITFTKLRPVDSNHSSQRFKKYLLLVVSASSVIVLVCIFIGIPKQDFSGYGVDGNCFVSKFWANLFAFTVPIVILYLVSMALLVIAITKIYSTEKQNSEMLSTQNNQSSRKKIVLTVLTLKLSVLLGLGWILGFIDGFVESNALSVCFTIIVSFQGTFVFIAFGHHRKIFNAFRMLLRRNKKDGKDSDMSCVLPNKNTNTTRL